MPRTVLRWATIRPVRYSAKCRRWGSLWNRSPYRARASCTTWGNSTIPGMSRCSGLHLRQAKKRRNRLHPSYFDSLKPEFAKDHSLLKRYVLRPLRALRWRSVPFCRSTNAVLIARLTGEAISAARTPTADPKTTRNSTLTTRPFRRVFTTVAYRRPGAGTLYGALGRPGLPVRGGVTVTP